MSKTPAKPEQATITLNLPEDLNPVYVNLARITHSPSELVFDFALMVPSATPAKVQTRVLMSPLSAKLFYRALGDNLSKYETKFGEIKIPGGTSLAENLFNPPKK